MSAVWRITGRVATYGRSPLSAQPHVITVSVTPPGRNRIMGRCQLIAVILSVILAACQANEERRVARLLEPNPTPASFSLCHGNSCRLRTDVSLSEAQWAQVRAQFVPAPPSALAERRRIAAAIGLLESLTGRLAGTQDDAPGMGVHWNPDGQFDCIDEATNSTAYLRMLAADGLIRFHTIGLPSNRFVLTAWGPSNTATIAEVSTGKVFAVESYFRPNGEPAYVLPLETWRAGWVPEEGTPPEV
jgi:hypothetical protein